MKRGIYTYKIDKNYMNFFRHEASLFASFFYVVNKFSYDDIFY